MMRSRILVPATGTSRVCFVTPLGAAANPVTHAPVCILALLHERRAPRPEGISKERASLDFAVAHPMRTMRLCP